MKRWLHRCRICGRRGYAIRAVFASGPYGFLTRPWVCHPRVGLECYDRQQLREVCRRRL